MLGQSVFYLTLLCAVNCLTIKGEKLTNHLNSNPHSHDDDSDKYSDDEAFFYKDDDFNSTLGTRRMIRPVNVGKMPIYFDWREHDGVSAVKNQERCGACWAFSTIANIESQLKIYLNQNEVLSEQFLIDCDEDNKGCSSASLLKTFAHIVSTFNGVLRYADYPEYTGHPMGCRWNGNPLPVPVIGFRRVQQDEDLMAEAIYKYGPLSAAINSASMDTVKNPLDIDEPTDETCPPDQLDHAVLIVGYHVYVDIKTGRKVPYWIIKNSWGAEWGDKGYYYLVRGRNACGIASDVSYAFVN